LVVLCDHELVEKANDSRYTKEGNPKNIETFFNL